MLYYLTAAGLIAHTFFWGLGLAWLIVPREWRRWGWVFAPGFGWALQSAVVWLGAHTPLAGTNSYAYASEVIPLLLLIGAVWRGQARGLRLWAGLPVVLLITGWLLLSPMASAGRGLTASSLGSCDQADYAAGARVFQEFARNDHTGFLGQPEVTHVRSTSYFFDFWLRLNHFTPSALLAHNAAVFGVEAYRLVSLTAAVLVLLNLPLLLFLARTMLGLRDAWLLGLVTLYAWSPLNAYAVHHGALGQLYAAQGIALLTLGVFGASRAAQTGRRVRPFFGLVMMAIWLLAGSYNFILTVCLAPAGVWLLIQLWRKRDLSAIMRVVVLIIAAGAVCIALFWGRFAGLIERFSLFEQYNFGWVVPLASPEGWLGIFKDTGLHAVPTVARVVFSLAAVALYIAGVVLLWRRQKMRALAALALVLPVVFGWSLLAWETRVRANASYDAYKILAVFYPGLLAGFGCWLVAAQSRPAMRRAAGALLVFLLIANLSVALNFRRQMSSPPLRVDRHLAGLEILETDARVTSLNMLVDDFWSRLWANAFLLRKPQYFAIHTYEGRLNTPLQGTWDLHDGPLRLLPASADDVIIANDYFYAVRAGAPGRLQAHFADGWYPDERSGSIRWRWSGGAGRILVINPSGEAVQARLAVRVRSQVPGPLELKLEQNSAGVKVLDGSVQQVVFEPFTLQPGNTVLTLAGVTGAAPGPGDVRVLSYALYDFELQVLATVK